MAGWMSGADLRRDSLMWIGGFHKKDSLELSVSGLDWFLTYQ